MMNLNGLTFLTILFSICCVVQAESPRRDDPEPASGDRQLAEAATGGELGESSVPPDAIHRFVKAPESVFAWKHLGSRETEVGTIHELHLVSQRWHDITWEHALYVYEPPTIRHHSHLLLFVTGGSIGRKPRQDDIERGLALANACGAPVATLSQVPNQPLLGDRTEDDLITETWLRYLETGDDTWPLLFPMVKSAVKAMDALQEFSRQRWDEEVTSFVMTGASKRGWTSWLTPVADQRVVATAPIVIDVLNFLAQMKNQHATWGEYSEQIHDYTSKGLVKISADQENERERQLRVMMDPFTYRRQLTLPKLMIVGTNDRYWLVDAMNIYWNDLAGPKYVLQVPNGGHDLGNGVQHALNTLAIYFEHIATQTPLPEIQWNTDAENGELKLAIQATPHPVKARLWSATADTNDFRSSTWSPQPLSVNEGATTGTVRIPETGHIATFGELEFPFAQRVFSLTTLVYRR